MKTYHTPNFELVICSLNDVIRTSGETDLFGSSFNNVVDWDKLNGSN